MSDDQPGPRTEYKLEQDSELRFEMENGNNEKVTVTVSTALWKRPSRVYTYIGMIL